MFLQDDAAVHLEDLNDVYVLVNFRPAVTVQMGVPAVPQREGMVAAHVDAVQNHTKSNYMRNPPAAEVFNEEICNLIKRKMRANPFHHRVIDAAGVERNGERKQSLLIFAENLERAFYGFEADFFQQNVSRIVDDVVSQIQGALELWPTLVEICYFQRHTKDLPKVKVANVHLGSG